MKSLLHRKKENGPLFTTCVCARAHTWVWMCMHVAQLIMEMSTLHTNDLRLASCPFISLRVLENAVLFVYRMVEFSARVCVCSYAWYGMDCQHCASSDCTCWFRYVRAKSFACRDTKWREKCQLRDC